MGEAGGRGADRELRAEEVDPSMNMSQFNSRSCLPSVVKLCGNAIPVRHGAGAFYREPIDLCLIGGTHCVSNEGFKYYYSQKDDKL